jgi:hypothetical protein
MRRLKIGLLATVVVAVLTIISTASAGVFGSEPQSFPFFPISSDACATGIYAGYCGTQQDSSTVPLNLAALGNTIIGTSSKGFAGSEDFFWFQYEGGSNDIAEWAPNGVASNEVMAVVKAWNGPGYQVVLQPATGAANQQWFYSAPGWTNIAAPGLVLQTNGNNRPVTMVPGPASAPNQSFTFIEGQ